MLDLQHSGRWSALLLPVLVGCVGISEARPEPDDEPVVVDVDAPDLSLARRVERTAEALVAGLERSNPKRSPRLALRFAAEDGFDEALHEAVAREISDALLRRVELLDPGPPVNGGEDLRIIERGGDGSGQARLRPTSDRWEATHLVQGRVTSESDGWRVHWQVVDMASGRILAAARHRVLKGDLSKPAVCDVDCKNPTQVTRAILAAIRKGDGAGIVHLLHPDLARRWRTRARSRSMSLSEYALHYFAEPPLSSLGHITEIEVKRKRYGVEVEVEFSRKIRDVDFKYRWDAGGWRLYDMDDYRR